METLTPMSVFAQVGPFSDELISGETDKAVERLQVMRPLDAVRLVLAAYRCDDAVIGDSEIDELATRLGVFDDGMDV